MAIFELKGKKPDIHPDVAYISPNSIIIGDVRIGKDSVIFDNVVIEADVAPVIIGECVNIQSQSVIHTIPDSITKIGNYITIGHRSVVHAAQIEDNVTIGIGALVASYVQIGKGSIIGEGAVVPQKTIIPELSLAVGVPVKIIRTISGKEEEKTIEIAKHYMMSGRERAEFLKKL